MAQLRMLTINSTCTLACTIIPHSDGRDCGQESRVAIVEAGGVSSGRGCNDSGVGLVVALLPPLVVFVLWIEPAVLRLVGRPCHVVLTPLKGKSAHLLFLGVAILGWHLLPFLVSLSEFLVGSILLILRLFVSFLLSPLLSFFLLSFAMALSLGLSLSWPLRALISAAIATIFSLSGDLAPQWPVVM
jgi:hypothetical protein